MAHSSPAYESTNLFLMTGNQISVAGLGQLTGLSQLYWLGLGSAQVTDAGVAELQQALHNCKLAKTNGNIY